MQNYRNLGLPQDNNIRNIAIASGSECAPGQEFSPYAELYRAPNDALISWSDIGGILSAVVAPFTSYPAQLFIGFPLVTRTDVRAEFVLNALPNRQSRRIYRGKLFFRKKILFVVNINLTLTDVAFNSLATMLPLDSSPGGIFDIAGFGGLPDQIAGLDLTFNHERFCFVPTTSALDIGQNGRTITPADLNARYSPTDATVDQDFDNFFTNPLANEDHIQFTLDNGRWMLDEMQSNSSIYSCLTLCGGSNFPTITGSNEVYSNTNYTVNNTSGLPVRWQVSGNLAIVSGSTSTTVTVRSTGSGGGRLTARVGSGGCLVNIPKDVQSGGTPARPTGINGPNSISFNNSFPPSIPFTIANPVNGITYEWRVSGGTITATSSNTREIAVTPTCGPSQMVVEARAFDGCNRSGYRDKLVSLNCGSGNSNFAIYPNPTDQYFDVAHIENASPELNTRAHSSNTEGKLKDQVKLELYNPQNAKLKTVQNKKKTNRFMVDHLKPGIYVLHIHYQGEVYQEKVAIKTDQ